MLCIVNCIVNDVKCVLYSFQISCSVSAQYLRVTARWTALYYIVKIAQSTIHIVQCTAYYTK